MFRVRLAPSITVLMGWLATTFLLLPVVALIMHVSWPTLLNTWATNGSSSLMTSLLTTTVSMILIVVFGTPVGWLLARSSRRVWKVVEFLLLIPLLLPPLVIGLLLVYFYGPYGFLGHFLAQFGFSASNTNLAVILAQLYEAIPYFVFAAQAAFHQVDVRHERVSLSLGVSPWRTWLRITLPLAWPGLAVGFSMAFARAIGAFGAVIVVAYYPHTLPVSIWIALQEQGLPSALPIALLLLLVALPLPLLTVLWRRWKHDRIQL